MSIFTGARRDAEAMRDAVVQTVAANDQLATSAEQAAAAYAKGARTVAPAPMVLGPSGAPVSSGSTSGGASRGSGSGSAGGGRGGEAFYIDPLGNVISLGALALDATGLPVFDLGQRVSGQSGGGGGGGSAPGRLGVGADQLGNRFGYRPGYATGGSGSTAPLSTSASGKAAVYDSTNASLLGTVARGVAETNRILGSLSRGDGGAQLFRERIVP